MPTTAVGWIRKVEGAADFRVLLGDMLPDKAYKHWAKLVHPDRVSESLRDRAGKAFARLGELYDAFVGGGDTTVKVGKYTVSGTLAKGDICDLYRITAPTAAVLKIARSAADNDLVAREQRALETVHARAKYLGVGRNPYLPLLLESFDASGRRANVLEHCDRHLTLDEIAAHFSSGIDFRHVVWMVNRTLAALAHAHREGIVHGALTSQHLLFDPANHDVIVIDWCYSATGTERIPAMVPGHESLYPVEVGLRSQPGPWTDFYMMAMVFRAVAGLIPRRFHGWFDWCLAGSPSARPDDAGKLRDRWKALAEQEYGPPKFFNMTIPVN